MKNLRLFFAWGALLCLMFPSTPYGQGLGQDTLNEIFELDLSFETGGYSAVWGVVRTDSAPWVNILHYGWTYLHEESTADGYWIWIENLGWIYSYSGGFPEAYHYDSHGWILLDLMERTYFKFWKYTDREWGRIEHPRLEAFNHYTQVPSDIQEISYNEQGHNFNHTIDIGEFLLYIRDANPVSFIGNLYFYSNDGWFYPYKTVYIDPDSYLRSIFFDTNRYKIRIEGNQFILTTEDMLWGDRSEESYPLDEP